ncbi:molybdenum cofactor biosynthesis protein MoaE [Thermodesulfovibrio sp.]|jgi:molybdopterin synthase catalytic subunit|uniref:molybdenum cofactor biosynthesis protein MoaE n=1 Tax=Thermodesulfovibrio TaxID=28261 RepID=UPI0026239A4B|nr:molybdenum cofactor biosynthesis protein MoaE [Thermodesulfovibrio sp.]
MIDNWIKEIKANPKSQSAGMILIHNGIVRETSKDGKAVKGMKLSYNKEKLEQAINQIKTKDGIIDVKVWINEGELKVGDDIMIVLVAGRLRTDVFPALQELVAKIKNEVVNEEEIF